MSNGFNAIFGLVVVGIVGTIGFSIIQQTADNGQTTEVVQDVYVTVVNGTEQSTAQKRVVMKSGNTYMVEDSTIGFHYNSGDLYAKLMLNKGKAVCIRSYGSRIPFMSAFPNVVAVYEGACN